MAKTITPNELGTEFGTDGRTARKFLRSITPKDEQPGKGSRWAIPGTKTELNKLRKQYDAWNAKQAEEKAARAQAAAEKAAEAVEEDADEVELDD